MAITEDIGTVDWEAHKEDLRIEAVYVWEQVKAGKIRKLNFALPVGDAVFILEGDSEEDVRNCLNGLPLVVNGLITYKLHQLVPYDNFDNIFQK